MNRHNVIDARLNAKHVADLLGCSEREVQRLAAQRRIRHHRIGRRLRFTADDINAYIESCVVDIAEPTSSAPATVTPIRRARHTTTGDLRVKPAGWRTA